MYLGGEIAGELVRDYLIGAGAARILGGGAEAAAVCRNSFVAGTPVHTPDGLVPIESLSPGDRVLLVGGDDDVLDRLVRDLARDRVARQASDLRLERDGVDETLGVTREHPFWVRDQGWVKAYRLAPGDHVFTESGAWARVVSNTPRTTRQYVYNLSVADDHTFFVGKVGAWVHNCVAAYEVGSANALEAASVVGDGLEIHHAGQAHAMAQRVVGYSRRTGPAIVLPKGLHRVIPNLRGTVTLSARQVLARDIWNLRRYARAPAGALRELIQLNKRMYPGAF